MIVSPNVKPTYTLMWSRILWYSPPCSTHSPFASQTSDIRNHVVQATNSGYTDPRACILASPAQHVPNHVPTLKQSPATPFHKIPYMAQSRYSLNSQVLAIFFPFATIAATPHYPVSIDRYSPQYGMLIFLLRFMTNTFFSTLLFFSPPPSSSNSFLNHTAGPVLCTPPSLTPLTCFSDPTPR